MTDVAIRFPSYFAAHAAVIADKGYFADLTVALGGHEYQLVFYDIARLTQTILADLTQSGYFHEANLVIVSEVSEKNIRQAVAELAKTEFASLVRLELKSR